MQQETHKLDGPLNFILPAHIPMLARSKTVLARTAKLSTMRVTKEKMSF